MLFFVFFFSSRRRHTRCSRDWSSDVCSSDLFRILGTRVPRVDTPDKVDGAAVFGLDVRGPGMVYATVARCPVFGGRVKSFDPPPALAVPGGQRVGPISSGGAGVGARAPGGVGGER